MTGSGGGSLVEPVSERQRQVMHCHVWWLTNVWRQKYSLPHRHWNSMPIMVQQLCKDDTRSLSTEGGVATVCPVAGRREVFCHIPPDKMQCVTVAKRHGSYSHNGNCHTNKILG